MCKTAPCLERKSKCGGQGSAEPLHAFPSVTELSGGLGSRLLTSEPRCLQVQTVLPKQSDVFNTTESERFAPKTQTPLLQIKPLPLGAARGERFCWSSATSGVWIQLDLLRISQNKAGISFLPTVDLSCSPGKDWLSPPGMCQCPKEGRSQHPAALSLLHFSMIPSCGHSFKGK